MAAKYYPCIYKGQIFSSLAQASSLSELSKCQFTNLVKKEVITDVKFISIDEYELMTGNKHPSKTKTGRPKTVFTHEAGDIEMNKVINKLWPVPDQSIWKAAEGEV